MNFNKGDKVKFEGTSEVTWTSGDGTIEVKVKDSNWILIDPNEDLTFPCDKCASPVPPGGAARLRLDCGYCEASTCPTCGFILCASGPLDLEDRPFTLAHAGHGMYGHRTPAEQPKAPVAVKRRG